MEKRLTEGERLQQEFASERQLRQIRELEEPEINPYSLLYATLYALGELGDGLREG